MILSYWVDFFENLQSVRGRSRNTVLAYRRDLEIYEKFKSTGRNISAFYDFLQKRGLSLRSQARVISSLRTYLKFCESLGENVSELRELRPPKLKLRLPQPLSVEDFNKLFDACQGETIYRTERNQLTLLLLFGLGCRVSELVHLNISHLKETHLVVTGTAGKKRLLPLAESLLNRLIYYLEGVRLKLIKVKTSSILINDRGRRPSRVDIWRWLSSWSKKAGFEKTVNPHKFRHGCATILIKKGVDIRSVQSLLGHSSIQSTQVYKTLIGKE